MRERLGLNEPMIAQLGDWFKGVLRGDLGDSYFLGRSVTQAIGERIPVTVALALCSMLVAVCIGFPLGIWAAIQPNTLRDTAAMGIALFGLSIPEFLMGLGLMFVFAVTLGWLPSGGYVAFTQDFSSALMHIVMPAFSLGFIQSALIARMTRSAMIESLTSDYVRTARAKGANERIIVWKHAFRNAALPIVTVVGLSFALLLGGAFITEVVFRLPGVGSLVISAVKRRDYPVVQGVLLVISTIVLLTNLFIDLTYAYLDPRVKYD